ncbi:hypothetical protein ACIRL2_27850 [Embleya sp. NPDC127516]|uniref:MmyB family transcriptional regulator n=1 Tax=Embleya sp. NPDC127516 TaxID=3363990 RepID=UPI0037FF0A2B
MSMYSMRLEQGRGPQPSVQVLAALAGALRLTEDARDHLYLLAGHRPPEGARAEEYLRPGLRYLLDRLEDVPVQMVSDLGDLPAQNDLALALFGCVCTVAEQDRNIVLGWFTDPDVRGRFAVEEHEEQARQLLADLRAATTRRGDDEASRSLVTRLRAASPEFTALWDRHEVPCVGRTRTGSCIPTWAGSIWTARCRRHPRRTSACGSSLLRPVTPRCWTSCACSARSTGTTPTRRT